MASTTRCIPVWAHRGAHEFLPENSMLAFEEAIRLHADGIETDLHLSSDNVVILLHDPLLDRTTDGHGLARNMPYYGGIDKLKSKRRPHCSVPRLDQLIELAMRPENSHLTLNLDCKETNDPQLLFTLVHEIVSRQDNYLTTLAPRLVISVWHPTFLRAAQTILPYARYAHLGCVPQLARDLCWSSCSMFMMSYSCLQTDEGQRFIKDCKAAGKKIGCWTVNEMAELQDVHNWGIDIIFSDRVDRCRAVANVFQIDSSLVQLVTDSYLKLALRWFYYQRQRSEDIAWTKDLYQKLGAIEGSGSPMVKTLSMASPAMSQKSLA